MRSILSITIFIVLAAIFSQPETSTTKYVPLKFTFAKQLNSKHSSNLIEMKFNPINKDQSYQIIFSKHLSKEIKKNKLTFNFAECQVSRRPKLNINCVKKNKTNVGTINQITLQPLLVIGEENINNYLLEISYMNYNGTRKKLMYLSSTENLSINQSTEEIKISKSY